jgi:hypothetical protein
MADQPPKSANIKLNGDHVVQMLKAAGLDTNKLDVRKAIPGAHVDYEELESRLKGTLAPSKGGWHVAVTVSRD